MDKSDAYKGFSSDISFFIQIIFIGQNIFLSFSTFKQFYILTELLKNV